MKKLLRYNNKITKYNNNIVSYNEIDEINYVIILTTRNNSSISNFISYDNGKTFTENSDLDTIMNGITYAPYLYITPDGNHIMINGYTTNFSRTIWSHDRGQTWNSINQSAVEYGAIKCSDDGNYILKGSWDNNTSYGIIYSKDGGTNWNFFEPSVSPDNRKYVWGQISPDGSIMFSNSQYFSSNVKGVFSSNYGDNAAYLSDIDNPSYPYIDTFYYPSLPTQTISENNQYIVNGGYGVFQNSNDYGYSWQTFYNTTKDVNHVAVPWISRNGQYQSYYRRYESDILMSSDYGVNWNTSNKSAGGTFIPRYGWWFISKTGDNQIASSTEYADIKSLWRNENFDINGWYITYTFSSDMIFMRMSSDGKCIIVQLYDGKIMYSVDGGTTFSESEFTNPLVPNLMYMGIN